MKRQVITIQESMVIYAPHHGEVWMTAWEIAELLNVTGTTVNNTIKRIWKQGVLKDFEHSQYIKLDNGYSADVYSLDVIIAIALQVDTYQALLFRRWLGKDRKSQRMSSYSRKAGANDDYRDEWNDAERYQLSITP